LGHTIVFAIACWLWPGQIALGPFLVVQMVLAITNGALHRASSRLLHEKTIGGVLILDVLLLTVLLGGYGGHTNPFSMVYLAHVVLGAVLVPRRWSWLISLLATMAFASLFFMETPTGGSVHHHGSGGEFDLHLQGMLAAFVLLAVLISGFVSQMQYAIDIQRKEIAHRLSSEERLAALTQMAAGAAHELGTPLATMKIVTSELIAQLNTLSPAEVRTDLECLDDQVDRCASLLAQMSPRCGEQQGEMPVAFTVHDLAQQVKARLPVHVTVHNTVRFDVSNDQDQLYLPFEALTNAILSLVKNGIDASSRGEEVLCVFSSVGEQCLIVVRDSGSGMSPEVRGRLGEPFFTTKEIGTGTGLGFFLCSLLVTRLKGDIVVETSPGKGTVVRMTIPRTIDWFEERPDVSVG
jgi:two-component system sensor histidine kinase RegB